MFYKVLLLYIFLTSTMIFIIWIVFTIKISNSDYKIETVTYRRYLEASAGITTQRPEVRRNDTYLQKATTRIATELKREFSSKNILFKQIQI